MAERTTLAPGLEISRVVTGLWQIADMERSGEAVDAARAAADMGTYVDAGLTTFDMADHYGSAEVIAGRYRVEGSAPAEMLTKWVPRPGPARREDAVEAVDRALSRLATERLDLLQFHAWNYADPSWLDLLYWLDELRQEGKIRHLGMTNCDAAHLELAIESGIPLVSNQVCYSLLDRRPAGAMADVCRRQGVRLLAYGTLAGGFLSERWLGAPEPVRDDSLSWSQMKYLRFIDQAGGWRPFQGLLEAAGSVARRLDVSLANVACRWVLEQEGVAGVIVGARLGHRSHMDDTLNVFRFTLDEEAHTALDEATERLTRVHGGCGDEYRRPPFLTAAGDLSHHLTTLPPPFETRTVGAREHVFTGTVWEDLAGFSRAVRQGKRILVSGTTATHGSRAMGGRNPAAQMSFIIDKVEGALQSLGAGLEHVTRTRVFLRNEGDWEAVSRIHGDRFRGIHPANTLVVAAPIGEEYLVEMEAEAELP